MLDSSWHLYQQHAYALRACQLRGGHVVTCLYDTVPLYAPAFCDPGMPTVFAEWLASSAETLRRLRLHLGEPLQTSWCRCWRPSSSHVR